MLKGIKDCFFFIGWANEVFALARTDVVIESFLKTALLFDLGNIQGGHLQTEFVQNILLDFWICCCRSRSLGKVGNIHIKVDMFIHLLPT